MDPNVKGILGLEKHFSEELCTTVIPRNVKLSEAPSYGMPALYYEPEAKGTIAYLALAGELINKFIASPSNALLFSLIKP